MQLIFYCESTTTTQDKQHSWPSIVRSIHQYIHKYRLAGQQYIHPKRYRHHTGDRHDEGGGGIYLFEITGYCSIWAENGHLKIGL